MNSDGIFLDQTHKYTNVYFPKLPYIGLKCKQAQLWYVVQVSDTTMFNSSTKDGYKKTKLKI